MQTMYDSVDPADIPSLQPGNLVAYYIDGRYAWPKDAVAKVAATNPVVSITVMGGIAVADVVDCEKGDVTPEQAAQWYNVMASNHRFATIYCSESVAPEVVQACAAQGIAQPQLWVASWTNRVHMAEVPGAKVVATQWTSDTARNFDESIVDDTVWLRNETPEGKSWTWGDTNTVEENPAPPIDSVTVANPIIATISRPGGDGGWLVFQDGSVWSIPPAPFYGSYPSLPASEREAPAKFVAAVYGDGAGHDGYTLISDGWFGGDAGLYRFTSPISHG